MASITPLMVKELRQKTGAGMADCKKALEMADGDMAAAIDELRKKGAASAAKRSARSANEGIIAAKTTDGGQNAAIVEINCETDFVARNEEFTAYAEKVAEAILDGNPENLSEAMNLKFGGNTIEEIHNEILAKFSEKIEIRRFETLSSKGFIADYIHAGSKLAVLVELNITNPSDKAKSLIRDIAMQIAAMNPAFVDRDEVDNETFEKEKNLYKEAAMQEGKKEEIAERIAQGKLEKYFQEQCLVEQAFVKDSKMTVKEVVKQIADDAGAEVKILQFKRYFLGEELD